MARSIDRILRSLLDAEHGHACPRCAEPVRAADNLVLLMGREAEDPGAAVPRCRACSAPLRGVWDVLVVHLQGVERPPSPA